MLTNDEKAKLAEIYEPILFMHRDEKYEPISPARYMTGCAMWVNKPAGNDRSKWGDGEHDVDDDFPRDALIPQSKLGVDMMAAAADGDIFIGNEEEDGFRTYQVSNEERELFIQQLSWSQGGPDQQGNRSSENFQQMDGFKDAAPSYYVDVRDQDSISAVPREPATPLPPGFENALRALYRAGFWLLTYRFFYAYHEERLTDCEIDSEVIRAKRAGGFFAEHMHGSYEGDWHAIAVVIPNPGEPLPPNAPTGTPSAPISPLDLGDDEFPKPDFVGFSRRARGVLVDIGSSVLDSRSYSLMAIASTAAGDARFTGNHVQGFVARGTHNLYASPGNNTAPKFDKKLKLPGEIVDTCLLADNLDYVFKEVEEVKEKIGNVVHKGKKAGIALAKILGGAGVGAAAGAFGGPIGAAIGALFGAWGGVIAAAVEGVLDPPPDSIPGQPAPLPGPNEVPDVGPSTNGEDEQPDFGTVATPVGLVDDLVASLGEEVIEVKAWEGPVADRIIDRTDGVQPWWEPDGDHPQGYRGLWGARVERDPFDRRSGSRIPAFEALFVNAVLTDQG
jgi:hypothetical protein